MKCFKGCSWYFVLTCNVRFTNKCLLRLISAKRQTFLFQNWPCKTVYSLFHYAILANYAWIFIEGAYLHSLIFQTMTENSKSHRYFIGFGWSKLLFKLKPKSPFKSNNKGIINLIIFAGKPNLKHEICKPLR